jgi:hypothetical protein
LYIRYCLFSNYYYYSYYNYYNYSSKMTTLHYCVRMFCDGSINTLTVAGV